MTPPQATPPQATPPAPKSPGAIDFDAPCRLWGGYLTEIPAPHVRKWPTSRVRRQVTVTMGIYPGIGRHYHVDLKEEDNPVWDARPRGKWAVRGEDPNAPTGWVIPHDDTSAGWGRTFMTVCDTRATAMAWIERMVAEHFPPETHVVVAYGGTPWRAWYDREGD